MIKNFRSVDGSFREKGRGPKTKGNYKGRVIRVFMLSFFVVMLLPLVTLIDIKPAYAASKIWDGGGTGNNWSTPENWLPDGVPQAGDDVVFDGTSTKASTIDASFTNTIGSLSINSGYANTITIANGLNISGAFNQSVGTFSKTGSTVYVINVGGSFSHNGGTFGSSSYKNQLTLSGTAAMTHAASNFYADVTIDGDITANSTLSFNTLTINSTKIFRLANYSLTVSGTTTNNGTFYTGWTNTLTLNGAVTNNSIISGGDGIWDINAAFTNNATGAVTATSGEWRQGEAFTDSGSLTANGGTFKIDFGGSSSINFQTRADGTTTFYNLVVDAPMGGSSNNINLVNNFTVSNDLTFNKTNNTSSSNKIRCPANNCVITVQNNVSVLTTGTGNTEVGQVTTSPYNFTIRMTGGTELSPTTFTLNRTAAYIYFYAKLDFAGYTVANQSGAAGYTNFGTNNANSTINISSGGTLETGTGLVSEFYSITNHGTFKIGTSNFDCNSPFTNESDGAVLSGSGTWYQSKDLTDLGSFNMAAGTFVADGITSFTITGRASGDTTTFFDFKVDAAFGSNNRLYLVNNFTVANDMIFAQTRYGDVRCSGNNSVITVNGNMTISSNNGNDSIVGYISSAQNFTIKMAGGTELSPKTVTVSRVTGYLRLYARLEFAGYTVVNESGDSAYMDFGTNNAQSFVTIDSGGTFEAGTGVISNYSAISNHGTFRVGTSNFDCNSSFTNETDGTVVSGSATWFHSNSFNDLGTFNLSAGSFTIDTTTTSTINITGDTDGQTAFNNFTVNSLMSSSGRINLVNNLTVNGDLNFLSTTNAGNGEVRCGTGNCVITATKNVTVSKDGTSSNHQTMVGNASYNFTILMTGGTEATPTTLNVSASGSNYTNASLYAKVQISGYVVANRSVTGTVNANFGYNSSASTLTINNGGALVVGTNLVSTFYSISNHGSLLISNDFDCNSIFVNETDGVISSENVNWYQAGNFTDNAGMNLTNGTFVLDTTGNTSVQVAAKSDSTTRFYNLTFNVHMDTSDSNSVNLVNSFTVNGDLNFLSSSDAGSARGNVKCPANNCIITAAKNVSMSKDGSSTNYSTIVGALSTNNLTIRMTGGNASTPAVFSISQTGNSYVVLNARLEIAGYVLVNRSVATGTANFGANNALSTLAIINGGTMVVGSSLTSSYNSISNHGTLKIEDTNFDCNSTFMNETDGTVLSGNGTWYHSASFTDLGTFNLSAGTFMVDAGSAISITAKASGTTTFYNFSVNSDMSSGNYVSLVNNFTISHDANFLSTSHYGGTYGPVRCVANNCVLTVGNNVVVTRSGGVSSNDSTTVGDTTNNFTIRMTGGTSQSPTNFSITQPSGSYVVFYARLEISGYTIVDRNVVTGTATFGHSNAISTLTINNGGTLRVGTNFISNFSSLINNGTIDAYGNNLTINNTFTNNNTFKLIGSETLTITNKDTTHGTVEYYGNGAGNFLSLNYGAAFYSLKFNAGPLDSYTINTTTTVNNELNLTQGSLNLGGNLSVKGNWVRNGGTFTPNNFTVTLSGTNQTVSGNTTFYSLNIANGATAMTVAFTGGTTTAVTGTFSVSGGSGRVVTLQSTDSNSWNLQPTTSYPVDYVNVSRSSSNSVICATNSTNGGNNVNWRFAGVDCGANITGSIYSDEGVTKLTTAVTVAIKVNGLGTTVCTNISGDFTCSIPGVTNDTVTVFLDNATYFGATITRLGSGVTISGLNIYRDKIIVRHEDSGPITNIDLDMYDSANNGNIKFTVDNTTKALTLVSGQELYVWAGSTYRPNANVTTPRATNAGTFDPSGITFDCNGAFTNKATGTVNPSSGTWYQGGDFLNTSGGTINITGGTFVWDPTSGQVHISPLDGTFYDFEINAPLSSSWGLWQDSGFNVTHNLTVTQTGTNAIQAQNSGTYPVIAVAGDVVVNGGFLGASTGGSSRNNTLRMTGTNKNLTINGGTLSAHLVVAGSINVTQTGGAFGLNGANLTVNSGGSLTVTGNATSNYVFTNHGFFYPGAGNFDSNGAFTNSSDGDVEILGGNWYQNGDFTNTAGGVFNALGGTVIFDATNIQLHINMNGANFNNLIFNTVFGNGYEGWIDSNFNVNGDLSVLSTGASGTIKGNTTTRTITIYGNLNISAGTLSNTYLKLVMAGNNKNLTQTGGNLYSALDITADTNFSLSGGNFGYMEYWGGITTTTIFPNVTVNVDSNGMNVRNIFVNNGTLNFSSGSINMYDNATYGSYSNNVFTNNNGATVNAGSSSWSVSGNFYNRGTFNSQNSSFEYNASRSGITFDPGDAEFNNFILDAHLGGCGIGCTNSMTVPSGFKVAGLMDLQDGYIGDTNSNTIIIEAKGDVNWGAGVSMATSYQSRALTGVTFKLSGTNKAFNYSAANYGYVNFDFAGDTTLNYAGSGFGTGYGSYSTGVNTTVENGAILRLSNGLTLGGRLYNYGTIFAGSGIFTMSNRFDNQGTFNGGTGTFNMNWPSLYGLSPDLEFAGGNANFNNINFTSGESCTDGCLYLKFTSNFNSAGTLNFNAGGISNPDSPVTVNSNGGVIFNGNSGYRIGGNNLTINFGGTENQSITVNTSKYDGNIVINKMGGAVSQTGAWILNKANQQFNISSATSVYHTNGYNFTLNGTGNVFSNNGTFRVNGNETLTITTKDTDSGTVEYVGDGGATSYSSLNYGNNYYNLKINSTSGNNSFTAAAATTTNNNFELDSGTFVAPATTLTVARDFNHTSGLFTSNNGTVILSTTNTANISGNTDFNNFSSTVAGKRLNFQAGTTQRVLGTTTLQGSSGSKILLRSNSLGNRWSISPEGTRNISNVDVQDSNNITMNTINPTTSINTGNNLYWFDPIIIASAGANGSITPTGTIYLANGDSQTFNMNPEPGYRVADVLVDNSSVGAVTGYTFNNILADHVISVSFTLNTYTITASAGPNGSISPLGIQTLTSGSDQTFNIVPNNGYHIQDVKVDGVSVGVVTSYTFTNILAEHTIYASFEANQTVNPPVEPQITYHTISASVERTGIPLRRCKTSCGFISPAGAIQIEEGKNMTFYIGGSSSRIVDVKVDGESVGPVTSYTFTNVAGNHTISAEFVYLFTITTTLNDHGTIVPNESPKKVDADSTYTFTADPDYGYEVDDVLANGQSILTSNCVFDGLNAICDLRHIDDDYVLHANFKKVEPPVKQNEERKDNIVSRSFKKVMNSAAIVLNSFTDKAAEVIKQTPPPVAYTFPWLLFLLLAYLIYRLSKQARHESKYAGQLAKLVDVEKSIGLQKESFIILSSHYLRTPVTIINGGVDLLSTLNKLNKEKLKEVNKIVKALNEKVEIIFGKISDNKHLQKIEKPDVKEEKTRIYTSVYLWAPVVLIGFVAFFANYLFVRVANIDIHIINLLTEIIVFVILTQIFFAFFRKRQTEKEKNKKYYDELKNEKILDDARNKFMEDIVADINPTILALEALFLDVPEENKVEVSKGLWDLKQMVYKFTFLAKLNAGKTDLEPRKVSVSELFKDFINAKSEVIEQKNLKINFPAEDLEVTVDKEKFAFILQGVIDNAIKFSKENSNIRINYSGRSISVEDEGIGMSREAKEGLFKPFVRGTSSMQFDYEGMGTNLYIAKVLADYLNIDIEVESEEGKGTKVTLTVG
jgi:signal transduction histidine kinase